LFALLVVSSSLMGQERIPLGDDPNLFGDNLKVIPGMIQPVGDRIYVDGWNKILMFDSQGGSPLHIFHLEAGRWIDNFTVIENSPLLDLGENLLVASTLKRNLEGKITTGIDLQLLFFKSGEEQLKLIGRGYHQEKGTQINFRNIHVLPDGRLIANQWVRTAGKSVMELWEIRFTSNGGFANSGKKPTQGLERQDEELFEIEYVEKLYTRAVLPGSPFSNNKSVVVAGSLHDDRVFFAYALENFVHILKPNSDGVYEATRAKLPLPGFVSTEHLHEPGERLPNVHSLLRSIIPSSDGGYTVVYDTDSQSMSQHFQMTRNNWSAKKTPQEVFPGEFVAFSEDHAYFYLFADGQHQLVSTMVEQ
jgi:hypothetical protein